ncbi:hypothetical protein GCM10017668_69590 [Streptomyces tuirus]|uniref:Uncharacterized protein n=1 Tax=Streptomyces tuirus TaxID=68278 RepID=A0A7G1NU56_9ACTN|nr:hypothetical protein GCM10017668_00260 [Streptomyces tuirus]BCL25116.1 hypothetical protein GCM10017668_69590 [Streptomyces tuirus]
MTGDRSVSADFGIKMFPDPSVEVGDRGWWVGVVGCEVGTDAGLAPAVLLSGLFVQLGIELGKQGFEFAARPRQRPRRPRGDREIRHLLAYGREFRGDRPYKLELLARVGGMTPSGMRTAYTSSEIQTVARQVGRAPDGCRSRPQAAPEPARPAAPRRPVDFDDEARAVRCQVPLWAAAAPRRIPGSGVPALTRSAEVATRQQGYFSGQIPNRGSGGPFWRFQ